jgi:hypothetical protein
LIGNWMVPASTLATALLGGSNTQAIGGDLAYRFGRDGNLGALDFGTAAALLGDADFAVATQTFGTGAAVGGPSLLGGDSSLAGPMNTGAKAAAIVAAGDRPAQDGTFEASILAPAPALTFGEFTANVDDPSDDGRPAPGYATVDLEPGLAFPAVVGLDASASLWLP